MPNPYATLTLTRCLRSLLTPTTTTTATTSNRIANTAALAFKARVALFEGTRAKFHNYGDAKKYLSLAVAACKAVMDSKQHDLYAGPYFNIFQYIFCWNII